MNPNKEDKEKKVEDAVKIDLGSESNEFEPIPTNISCQSPEISTVRPDSTNLPNQPSFDSTMSNRRTFNKSKTRFDQPSPVLDSSKAFSVGDDEEVYRKELTSLGKPKNIKRMTTTTKFSAHLLVFLLLLACLLSSLLVKKFKAKFFLGVEVWKWFVVVMVTFSGLLISKWFVQFIVYLIARLFLLTRQVVYFIHGLKDNIVVVIWFALILGTWLGLLMPQVTKTHKSKNVLRFITMTLVTLLIGSFLWLLKTTLIRILVSTFHYDRFFTRLQEAAFHHYVLLKLSSPPVLEEYCTDSGIPYWDNDMLLDMVTNSGFSKFLSMLSRDVVAVVELESDDMEFTAEEANIAKAVRIFRNVVDKKNQKEQYIERADLIRFMSSEQVDHLPLRELFDKEGHIDRKRFIKWAVQVFQDGRALQLTLNDNLSVVYDLNKILIGLLIIMMIILWLLITEIAPTQFLLFLFTQLIAVAFIFGNTCKAIFESIIFVFVMHPFDVSDRCVIDGETLIVEKMSLLTTEFLKVDTERVFYPNAVLATKAIGNHYGSLDQGDTFEFAIDYSTPLPKIEKLKEKLELYLEQYWFKWYKQHNLVVTNIENLNKINMILYFNHTLNFQDFQKKVTRRSDIILALKNILDSLEITYNHLPQ